MIDQEAITKVISNLMSNALKYTEDYVRLSCRLLENGTHFRIEVEDNGLGISPDERRKSSELSIRHATTTGNRNRSQHREESR